MKTRRIVGVLVAATTILAACGDDDLSDRAAKVAATTVAPVTTTTVPAPLGKPERIVSLSPSATEMLFAIGAGAQVVAVDSFSNYPLEAPITDLSAFDPNVEAIVTYQPDLVITDGTNQQVLDQLNEVGVATLAARAPKTLNGAFEQMETLGAATGNIAGAAGLVMQLEAEVAQILAGVPDREGALAYYYELDDSFFSASSKTFIGAVLELLGMVNIADEVDNNQSAGYPQLTPEFIIDADPDVILLADTKCCQQTPETVAGRPGWDTTRAVAEGHVIALDDDVASRWGPHIEPRVDVDA
jgi:iron complex transport system substrate-binding protein